ncbi:hypothetical protein CDL15_Pgr012987 [Punica granatum]|uniref:Uncharacterized protein n=1 Tax=Punica granatum TaxID=22663 RepID=A0A218XFK9_PUNGR|nr:hypothetical protein CDL15_Pgr012987 [Punica granatum]
MSLPHKYPLLSLPPAMTDAGAAPPPPTLTFRLEPPGRELRRAQQAPPSLMLSSCRDSEITGTPRALPSVRVHRLK